MPWTRRASPARDPAADAVKAARRRASDEAIARGLFGVPTFTVDDKLFWGFDALPMLRAWLEGDPWFAAGAWEQAGAQPVGTARSH